MPAPDAGLLQDGEDWLAYCPKTEPGHMRVFEPKNGGMTFSSSNESAAYCMRLIDCSPTCAPWSRPARLLSFQSAGAISATGRSDCLRQIVDVGDTHPAVLDAPCRSQ